MNKNKYIYIISICIFFFFYYFYTHSVPLVFGNGDDWNYLSYTRSFFHIIGEHNPTKIFTESLMSINADIATSIIMPFTNDFCQSITIINAITLSLCITFLFLGTNIFLRRIIGLNIIPSIFLSIIFLLLHFIIFRSQESQNDFMFYSWDLTCYYHYTIPNILSALLVLCYLIQPPLLLIKERKFLSFGFFMLFTLIVLVSNLYSSIIFISYIIASLLYKSVKEYKDYYIIKDIFIELMIISIWTIIHLIEMILGGRGSMLLTLNENSGNSLFNRIVQSFLYLYNKLSEINSIFLILLVISIICIIHDLKKRKENKTIIWGVTIACFINIIYLIMLSANVYPYYMLRAEVLFGPCFYIFMLISISFALLSKHKDTYNLFLPLLCFTLLFECRTPQKTYKDTMSGYSPTYWTRMNKYIISSVQAADKARLNEVTIFVPKFKEETNWPLPIWTGKKIARTLYKHNLIERPIIIKINPDLNFNVSNLDNDN